MKSIQWTFMLALITCSCAFCQSGPGGIGTNANLAFWLDANAGAYNNPVDSWIDISGNSIGTTVNGNPTRVSGALNGMSVIRFDGDGDEVYTTLSISADSWPLLSVMAVYIPRSNFSGSVWGEDNGNWDRFLTDMNLAQQTQSAVGAGFQSDASSNIPNLFVTNTPVLTTVTYEEDVLFGTNVFVNGSNAASFISTAVGAMEGGSSNLYVGAIGSNGYRFNGDIAEIVVFQSDLSTAHRIIAENYLAAKYGLTLTSHDLYTEDDLGYDYDVAGIGALGASSNTNSRGSGIVRIWNASNLTNNEFLFWGHDNGTLQAVNTTDVPTGVQARSGRVWKVSEVNIAGTSVDVGTVNLSFNLAGLGLITPADLRLLVDSDNDGNFADETPIGSASFLGNDEYAFTGVNALADNLRFTIATINALQTPLPVKLKYFHASLEGSAVKLTWQSLMEKNISAYSISRSTDGIHWTHVDNVPSAGPGNYSLKDEHFPAGTSYYKLNEIGLDFQELFCGIATLQMTNSIFSAVFPNPAQDHLTVPINGIGTEYRIVTLAGIDYTRETRIINQSETQATVDVSELPSGSFFIWVRGQQGFHFTKSGRD